MRGRYLYDARNRFLHGEPVRGKNLRIRGDRAPLLRLAATVYRRGMLITPQRCELSICIRRVSSRALTPSRSLPPRVWR